MGRNRSTCEQRAANANPVINVWRGIWSVDTGKVIGCVRLSGNTSPSKSVLINSENIPCAVRTAQNNLHNFWIRCSHYRLATQYQEALEIGSLA